MNHSFPDFKTVGEVFEEYTNPSVSNPYRSSRWRDLGISEEDLSTSTGNITMVVIRTVDQLAQWVALCDPYGFDTDARSAVSSVEVQDGILVEPILAVVSRSSEETYFTYVRWSLVLSKVQEAPNVQ